MEVKSLQVGEKRRVRKRKKKSKEKKNGIRKKAEFEKTNEKRLIRRRGKRS